MAPPPGWDWAVQTLPFAFPPPLLRAREDGPPEVIVTVAEARRRRIRSNAQIRTRPPPPAIEDIRVSPSPSLSQSSKGNVISASQGTQPNSPPVLTKDAISVKGKKAAQTVGTPPKGKTPSLENPTLSPKSEKCMKSASQKGEKTLVKPPIAKSEPPSDKKRQIPGRG